MQSQAIQKKTLESLTKEQLEFLAHDWQFWARDKQRLPTNNFYCWLILAGRGFGKTRTGAETVRIWIQQGFNLVNLIGPTVSDARDAMIKGESGILAICPNSERPEYKISESKLLWPNGAESFVFTAEEPERLRNKQHQKLWCDELAGWQRQEEAWDMAMFGLRLGKNPQVTCTTTPKPTTLVKKLVSDPTTFLTRGTSYENRANLSPKFFETIIKKYEGTRLGRQELLAEILEDVPGALWAMKIMDENRVGIAPEELIRIVIGVDPEASSSELSAETGIIIGGITSSMHSYILGDYTIRGTPHEWGSACVRAYNNFKADVIVGETNNGGEMVGATILTVDPNVNYKEVRATRGKYTRAEPISALYERGLVHHVGVLAELESQMTSWTPGDKSPDRMDALVWVLTELYYGGDDSSENIVYDERVNISPV